MNKIVVADAGPLIALARIERLSLLFALYGSVVLAPGRGDGSKARMTRFAWSGSGSMTEAAASQIIVNAHSINAGHQPEPAAPDGPDSDFHLIRVDTPEAIHERLLRVVTARIPARFALR